MYTFAQLLSYGILRVLPIYSNGQPRVWSSDFAIKYFSAACFPTALGIPLYLCASINVPNSGHLG